MPLRSHGQLTEWGYCTRRKNGTPVTGARERAGAITAAGGPAGGTGYRRELLAAAVAEARAEVARTDAKAGVLLTLATGALAGLVTLARAGHRGAAAPVLLWLATAVCAAAVVVLLTAVRPRFVDTPRGMLADHAALLATPACGLAAWQERRLRLLSALAVAKHRRVRRAVDLLLAGLVLLAAAAPLVLGGP